MENLPQKEEWDEELLVEQMLPQRGNRSVEKELDLIERKIPLPDYFLLPALYPLKSEACFFAVKPVTVDPKLAKNELQMISSRSPAAGHRHVSAFLRFRNTSGTAV